MSHWIELGKIDKSWLCDILKPINFVYSQKETFRNKYIVDKLKNIFYKIDFKNSHGVTKNIGEL